MSDNDELLTIEEVAGWLKLQPRTLYNWRSAGTGPPSIKVGRGVRYRRLEVMQWIADGGTTRVQKQAEPTVAELRVRRRKAAA